MLSNEDFVKFVSNQIDIFLTTNRTPGISASLLWETLKVYIKGEIISYSSYANKQRKTKLKEVRLRISQLDNIYASSPSPNIYKDRLSLQFDVLSTKEVEEHKEVKAKYCYYEYGDKATKLLAHQLRQASSSQQIPQIHTPSDVTTDPTEKINDQFKQFPSSFPLRLGLICPPWIVFLARWSWLG